MCSVKYTYLVVSQIAISFKWDIDRFPSLKSSLGVRVFKGLSSRFVVSGSWVNGGSLSPRFSGSMVVGSLGSGLLGLWVPGSLVLWVPGCLGP